MNPKQEDGSKLLQRTAAVADKRRRSAARRPLQFRLSTILVDIFGVVAAGCYAMVNVLAVRPSSWPHKDLDIFLFLVGPGFFAALFALTLHYAIAYLLECGPRPWTAVLSYGILFAAEAYAICMLLLVTTDV